MADPVDTTDLRVRGLQLHAAELSMDGAALVRAADEVDRLRTVIENAPHNFDDGLGCWAAPGDPAPCTCWKADAL